MASKLNINNTGVDSIKRLMDKMLLGVASAIGADAQRLAPSSSGTLRNSIRAESTGSLSAAVGSDLPYAIYVEESTNFLSRPLDNLDLYVMRNRQ